MLFPTLYWIATAVQCFTCLELVRRRLADRLLFFFAFAVATAGANIWLGTRLGDYAGYMGIAARVQPLLALLQICAGLEAYRWLASSLVRFQSQSRWVLAAIVTIAASCEFAIFPGVAGDPIMAWVAGIEHGVGVGLWIVLMLSLTVYRALGAPSTPRWHALCLAALSLGSAVGWRVSGGAYVVIASIVGALGIWNLTVRQGPTWEEREAAPYDSRPFDRKWRDVERDLI